MQAQPFLEILTAAFNTGEIKPYAISGGYFEILDCAYPVTVNLIGRHGELRGIMRNAEASFYLKGGDYETITIESPQAQVVRFAFGTSEAGTRRTAGVVQVVDGGKARTVAGATFLASVSTPAGAGLYSHCQIWNPAGSGKNLVLQQAILGIVTGTGSAGVLLRPSNVALTTLVAAPQSKDINGAAGAAQARSQQNAAALGATQLAAFSIQSLVPFVYRMTEPIVIRPGNGLLMVVTQVNTTAELNAEFYEETI